MDSSSGFLNNSLLKVDTFVYKQKYEADLQNSNSSRSFSYKQDFIDSKLDNL